MSFISHIKAIEDQSEFKFESYDEIIVLPPPNITGKLHIGHALNVCVQDFKVRFERLNGKNILWIPGTDHSGIATQILVEKSIMPLTKYDLGREKFLNKVWEWKEKYQDNIYSQLKSLGVLLSWDHAKFTMDEDIQISVSKAFCELYEAGLIYKAKKMIYWDTKLETAISDLEVKSEESNGELYYIKYELDFSEYESDSSDEFAAQSLNNKDKLNQFITVATTRPETLFGDQAIAVNPNDVRYKDFIGLYAKIPLTNRKIKIISDERCEIEMGTGAVKITPAHDFLDFEIGQDHNLECVDILDKTGSLDGSLVPDKYVGIDRFEVRKMLVADLGENLEKVEKIKSIIPFGDRSNTILEPRLTDQWFIDTDDMAKDALRALEKIKIYPEHMVNTYKHWMNNIQPWCISRQLWWGHRIPVWYCDEQIIVALDKNEAEKKAKELGLDKEKLVQENDVLDTWFSSALWPFTTIENNDLDMSHYPNKFLVTGSDILFFWVARMVMFGCFFKKDVPFKEVYLHGLVQDNFGKKMSKSKNNVIDPIGVVDKEGKDVLRFALLYSSIPGKNTKFGDKNIEHSRHFCIKIWNLYKYIKNSINNAADGKGYACAVNHVWNIWILHELKNATEEIKEYIDNWDLYHASHKIYKVIWDVFCNWYLEGAKYLLNSEYKEETQYVLESALHDMLIILHPFIPFLSNYIYKDLFNKDILEIAGIMQNLRIDDHVNLIDLDRADKDRLSKDDLDGDLNKSIGNDDTTVQFIQNVTEEIRFIKAIFEIEKKAILHISDQGQEAKALDIYGIIKQITKCEIKPSNDAYKSNYIPYPVMGGFLSIPIKDYDKDVVQKKFTKIKNDIEKDYNLALKSKNNPKFMLKAPEEIREEINLRVETFSSELKKVDNIIQMWENSL
ncbi:valine--tRNA ligase [Candidatus Cytomitobacter primus]|uniref:Valine--tRNA ligase n=1 Tax=Candidatus Cytomitobacter primus TaxID=2066024 RepID=A0A5C0UF25_9PROT|nr:valine--tRNA ligase [Candidatus Cytomitobacter primus]QEK38317.1 valine--tRNA ligase [Candidatus Cytomitobacter primus]